MREREREKEREREREKERDFSLPFSPSLSLYIHLIRIHNIKYVLILSLYHLAAVCVGKVTGYSLPSEQALAPPDRQLAVRTDRERT